MKMYKSWQMWLLPRALLIAIAVLAFVAVLAANMSDIACVVQYLSVTSTNTTDAVVSEMSINSLPRLASQFLAGNRIVVENGRAVQ